MDPTPVESAGTGLVPESAAGSLVEPADQQQNRASSLPLSLAGRVTSMRYQLQERSAVGYGNDAAHLSPVRTRSVTEEGSSEAESDSFPEWEPSSPDMHTSLLQHHSRHAQHKQRQRQSRLAGRQTQPPQQSQQRQESQQHGEGSSSIFGAAGGLLSGLFHRRRSSNAGQHDDPADAAAATADLLESGGSLTFQAASLTRRQQQEASSAAATAAAGVEPAAAASSSKSSTLRHSAAPAEADEAAARCASEPVFPASRTASATARSGQLNEQVFDTNLGGVGIDRPHRASHSISIGQLSKGKRRWQSAAQKVIGINHITSTYRPGALQVGWDGQQCMHSECC